MQIAFPQDILEYMVHMPLYKGVFWHRNGVNGVIVKLPTTVPFTSMEATFGTFLRDSVSLLHITLHLQSKNARPTTVECLLHLAGMSSLPLIRGLLATEQIEVYAITPDRAYLGIHLLPWSTNKRRTLRAMVRDLLPLQEQEIQPSLHPQKEAPHIISLHEQYKYVLHELHVAEEATYRLERQDASLQSTLTSSMLSNHTFEEHVLAYSHPMIVTNKNMHLFSDALAHESIPATISFPNHPFWLECPLSIPRYWRQHIGVFGFRATYDSHPLIRGAEEKWFYRSYESRSPWRLDFVDADGTPFLRLLTETISTTEETRWIVDPAHICPTHTCMADTLSSWKHRETVNLCTTCFPEANFWCEWSNALLSTVLQSSPTRKYPPRASLHTQLLSTKQAISNEHHPTNTSLLPSKATVHQETASCLPVLPSSQKEPKPVIVTHALLIDRYTQMQHTTAKQDAIERASKYLWMHSAWYMTEALRYAVNQDEPLHLPASHIYIELEQPHQLNGQLFAACSLLHLSDDEDCLQRWQYTVIDREGKAVWTIFYEIDSIAQQSMWMLPKEYACPIGRCKKEVTRAGLLFILCATCQQRIADYTTWMVVVLRMIAGDFQEQVEMHEPEEVLEISTKVIQDDKTSQSCEKKILRRFKVIRYYDACVQHGGTSQTRRGSWMTGKPLAESEYDVNPNAIIYVQIQPRDHDRTYKHDRYIRMKGKTQHIDPPLRLQPMTIATFRQLARMQKITKVFASTFE